MQSNEESGEAPKVQMISLGAAREIWFRELLADTKAGKSWSEIEKLALAPGSAAIMHAGMQRDWQHRIPKSPLGENCGPRISLTYRRLI